MCAAVTYTCKWIAALWWNDRNSADRIRWLCIYWSAECGIITEAIASRGNWEFLGINWPQKWTELETTRRSITQEQFRRETCSDKSVQVTPTTRAELTQTTTSTSAAYTQTSHCSSRATSTQTNVFVCNKTTATQTTKTAVKKQSKSNVKCKPEKSTPKSVSTAFTQRLKQRLNKAEMQLKNTTAERDEQRRNNYQLNQNNKRLMVSWQHCFEICGWSVQWQ